MSPLGGESKEKRTRQIGNVFCEWLHFCIELLPTVCHQLIVFFALKRLSLAERNHADDVQGELSKEAGMKLVLKSLL